jgi:hypothetical protein
MSEQDMFPAEEPDNPRDMTPDELEEALRWLEELAGKQGKSLDGLVTLDETPLEDSPFKGLFDSDEQELPDWLREVPSLSDAGGEVLEGESRLDWLARMANRESVEELPTLEWRRLTEGEELDDAIDAMPEAAAAIAGLPTTEQDEPAVVVEEAAGQPAADKQLTAEEADSEPETASPDNPPAVVDLMKSIAKAEAVAETDTQPSLAAPIQPASSEATPDDDTPSVPADSVAPEADRRQQVNLTDVSDTLYLGDGPDDLDEAMAWLEELAASQDAPIEDLPSVADRALASKLIAEAASGLSTGDGLDMSQLGIAMSGIYVGETKLAPTGPLVGEGPADETPDSAIYAEMALALEPDPDEQEDQPVAALGAGDEYPAAATDDVTIDAVAEAEVIGPADISVTEELSGWEEPTPTTEQPAQSTAAPSLADLMAHQTRTLAERLALIDRLAMPAGLSLAEINALLAAEPTPVKVTPFSLESTLDWLEAVAAGRPGADSLDASLVAAMPDDPDEAQAWLEQMAGVGETATEPESHPIVTEAVAAFDLTEADLLDMPEDPDAAIAWIESLAARRERTNS